MLQCFIIFFRYLYFSSTIADTSHIPSTITLAKDLSTKYAEAFSPHEHIPFFYNPLVQGVQKLSGPMSTYLLSIASLSFPMSD